MREDDGKQKLKDAPSKAFSDALEQGASEGMEDLIDKRKAALLALEQYIEAVEKRYFEWGYERGRME